MILFQQAKFTTSAPDITKLPADVGIEVAFAGRSNAGKSSALNTLTRQKSLARTSKTPGRTQLINVFELDEHRRLIDLPGYGFAKVPEAMKRKWQAALGEYLQERNCLKGIVILMDIRHPMKDLDLDLIHWAADSNLSTLLLLTKADKLKAGPRKSQVLKVREACKDIGSDIEVQAFSSLKGFGLAETERKLNEWFNKEFDVIEDVVIAIDEKDNESD